MYLLFFRSVVKKAAAFVNVCEAYIAFVVSSFHLAKVAVLI